MLGGCGKFIAGWGSVIPPRNSHFLAFEIWGTEQALIANNPTQSQRAAVLAVHCLK